MSRTGYILLFRQAITPKDWKTPERTLAWIDFLTLADYETGIVTASYGFLATRWGKSKGTVHLWIQHWIAERQVERQAERSAERNAERFFVVRYAEYQRQPERVAERLPERSAERRAEPMYKVSSSKSVKTNQKVSILPNNNEELKDMFEIYKEYSGQNNIIFNETRKSKLKQRLKQFGDENLRKAWATMATDKFLRGENDAKKDYLTIDYALRVDRIEHWLNHYQKNYAKRPRS